MDSLLIPKNQMAKCIHKWRCILKEFTVRHTWLRVYQCIQPGCNAIDYFIENEEKKI
jgi:hypothetical protein